jgi:FKBP-type peptidyl-prolyl cis-trans isomerase
MVEDDLSDLQDLQLDTDGSVTKSFRRRGTGKLRPARGERVTCHVVARLEEGGDVFASTRDSAAPLQFVIGDTTVEGRMDLTDIPSGLNEGLVTMALGEVASFKLAASKAHGEAGLTTGVVPVLPGATVEYEVELLSWAQDLQKDGGLLLTRVAAAGGSSAPADRACPTDLTTVCMRYVSREATSQTVIEDFSDGVGVEFMIDDGTVMLGLELAAKQMQAGEKAHLEINTLGPGGVQLPYGYASMAPDHPHAAVTGPLVLELELLPFTPTKVIENLSGAERLAEVERVRELGVRKFQAGHIARARRRFERALTVASHRNLFAAAAGTGTDPPTQDESERLQEHRAALSNNIAACCVKLEEWDDTLAATATTLQIKPEDTKALYRQGLAYNRLGSYDRAKKALKMASRLETAKEKLADRALLRLIKAEFNGVTNQGLERNKEKEKETWGGKLQSTEPQETPPTGLIAKAATAIGSAVGVQRKPAKGGGESPLSPKKKRKKKSGQQASNQLQAEQATARTGAAAAKRRPEPPVAGAPAVTNPWWSVLRKIAPAAGVVLVLLFMLRRRR